MGCCAIDALCDRCLHDGIAQLRGVAACRGEVWAQGVARRAAAARAWPGFDGRCRQIARRKVADLSRDARMHEELARICARWAARWWAASVDPPR